MITFASNEGGKQRTINNEDEQRTERKKAGNRKNENVCSCDKYFTGELYAE